MKHIFEGVLSADSNQRYQLQVSEDGTWGLFRELSPQSDRWTPSPGTGGVIMLALADHLMVEKEVQE